MKKMKKILTNIWFWIIICAVLLLIWSWITFIQYLDVLIIVLSVIILFYETTEKAIHEDFDNDIEEIKDQVKYLTKEFFYKVQNVLDDYKVVDHEKN